MCMCVYVNILSWHPSSHTHTHAGIQHGRAHHKPGPAARRAPINGIWYYISAVCVVYLSIGSVCISIVCSIVVHSSSSDSSSVVVVCSGWYKGVSVSIIRTFIFG